MRYEKRFIYNHDFFNNSTSFVPSYQQTQNGGIHKTDVLQKCMDIQEMIVRYNFLYKSVILKLLHKFGLRRKKNELRGKNKRKILSAAANSMCKLLPLPAQLMTSIFCTRNNFYIYLIFFSMKISNEYFHLAGFCYILEYTVRSRKKLNIG